MTERRLVHESAPAQAPYTSSSTAFKPVLTPKDAHDAISILSLSECNLEQGVLENLFGDLKRCGVQVQETDGRSLPQEALLHDRAAVVPRAVVSPMNEWGVQETLKLFKKYQLYDKLPVSVRSGGHGYFNGASCSGVMLNLASMTNRRIEDNTLIVEPGCILGQLVDTLARHRKAVPHGDCFGVGAGGHFLTAGWDLILARRYGLGCQSVIGGRVVLWDGSVVDVDDKTYPELLYAMRGGAVAQVGVVTELRLRVLDEPLSVTWRFTSLDRDQIETLVTYKIFANALQLPRDISISFRFHFEHNRIEPVCSFNIVSLLSVDETIRYLRQSFGDEVMLLIEDLLGWQEKALLDLRLLPASDFLANRPEMLAKLSPVALHENPLDFWKPAVSSREMARSFFTSISYWVVPECETILLELFDTFRSVQDEADRGRMYALLIQGGGRIAELQNQCSMPLGVALARFEIHWDHPDQEKWSRQFTAQVSEILKSKEDSDPGRPYRGDIWLEEQGRDAVLDGINVKFDKRF